MRYYFFFMLLAALVGCSGDDVADTEPAGRTIVLGFDGMDPNLAAQWMASGDLPNFATLAQRGHFGPLATSIPAQSPVAWSSFATGLKPGAHGIYDFLRRDPANYLPSFSVSETLFADTFIEFGDWRIPLEDAVIRNRRVGTPFWTELESEGGSATVLRVPVTFPPDDIDYMVAGMGVPDLLGTQGTYTIYSTRPLPGGQSGRVVYMKAQEGGLIDTALQGPPHPLTRSAEPLEAPMQVYPGNPGTGIVLGDSEVVLRKGEWSDWVNVSFNLLGLIDIPGLVRLYLLEDYPRPKIYVSPIQIDPHNPVVPITSPGSYASELADRIGLFHTIGMPEETWSLNNNHLTDKAFLEVAATTLAEREAMLFDALANNRSDLVVTVFVQTDRISHMFYRGIDPEHALYEETDEEGRNAILQSYREADRIVGKTMQQMHMNDRLVIISDHGFSPFRWSVHLNRWLVDNGYMVLKKGRTESDIGFADVDWPATRAYAVGLNGLFLNVEGREAEGIVQAGEITALKREIKARLLEFRDEEREQMVVKTVYDGGVIYPENENDDAPELVVGYARGYRASWQTSLGAVPARLVDINRNKWSGDHCIAVDEVPGVLFTSFKPEKPAESIHEVAAFLLERWKAPTIAR